MGHFKRIRVFWVVGTFIYLLVYEITTFVDISSMTVYTINNVKGGVAKSTTSHILATIAARKGQRVLLIDADGQASLTRFTGTEPQAGVADALRNLIASKNANPQTINIEERLEILPGTYSLFSLEDEIALYRGLRHALLDDLLRSVALDYDIVIIDTPPHAGWLVYNALFAADRIIVPIQCEAASIEGIGDLSTTLDRCSEEFRKKIPLSYIVPSFLDGRRTEQKLYLRALRKQYGEVVTKTEISTDSSIPRSQTQNCTIMDLKGKKSRAIVEYEALANEVFQWQ